MAGTVIQHVLARLKDIGITEIFGVPGDFAFPVNDAICEDPDIRWIGCCNELNAAYAADGYARVKGVAAISTTYGVGELAALAGIAGSFAEHLPVFHLVGTPNMSVQSARALMHHTLGNGEYDLFRRMSEPVVCGHAVMTPQNAAYETERLIAEALYHRRPVYMAFPADLANQQILGTAAILAMPQSEPAALDAAATAIMNALAGVKTACLLPGILLARCGLVAEMQAVVDASGLPFATMFMAKSVLEERQAAYAGMYDGALMNKAVRTFVEGCDRLLSVGSILSDFNTGAFTARLDLAKVIFIAHHHVKIGDKIYQNVEMGDILRTLATRLPRREDISHVAAGDLGKPSGKDDERITAKALYPRWERFLQPDDILVAETGTVSMGLGFAHLPMGASFHNQTLWGSIGWATPAALGCAIAAGDRRVVLVTGEGSHQLTVQEISQFGRLELRPVIFVLNNDGYLIERLLCKDPAIAYNDVASWRYAELPHAFGCNGWFSVRVTTCGELDEALERATHAKSGVYIEVVTGAYEASPLAITLGERLKAFSRG